MRASLKVLITETSVVLKFSFAFNTPDIKSRLVGPEESAMENACLYCGLFDIYTIINTYDSIIYMKSSSPKSS